MNNFPNTIQLGDITKWRDWEIDWSKIDLLLAGFSCQSWSVAGNQLGIEDERGKLFLVMLDIRDHIKKLNPNLEYLFENVKMKKTFKDFVTSKIGIEPILINSALVSAQRRERLYWTTIPNVTQPQDKGILLQDILENGVVDRDKSYCIDANYFKGGSLKQYLNKARRQLVFNYSSSGRGGGKVEDRTTKADKALTLTATGYSNRAFTGVYEDYNIRKLTPIECERLQTLPDNYTMGISNTQRYKCIGNGWTVDVIAHILKGLLTK